MSEVKPKRSWRRFFGLSEPIEDKRFKQELSFKENIAALKNLPRFLKMIWLTSKPLTVWNVLLRLLQSAIPLLMLYVGKLIIDEVIGMAQLAQSADGIVSWEQLWWYVGIEFGLAFASDLLSRGITLTDALLGDLFSNESSVQLMEHAANLDLAMFEDAVFYDKLERARRQTTGRVVLMSQLLSQVQDIVTISFLGIGLVVFNPWLILLLLLAVIPAFISESYFNKHGYSLTRGWTPERRELDYLRFIGATNESAKEIKIFGLANFLTERFSHIADRYYQANRQLAVRRALWGGLFQTLASLGYYVAYVFIIVQTVKGILSIGDLTFLAGSFDRLRRLLQGVLSRFSTIAQRSLYLQDLFDFLDMKPAITSPVQQKSLAFPDHLTEGIVFENVSFKYPQTDIWAVRNLSFHLKAGEKLALVGENGAGKTTVTKLIARLYDPTEGRILLDGKDLKEYDLSDLRQHIGVIFQDFVRFNMTAAENIAIGHVSERDDRPRIVESAELSLADQVIKKLPKEYDQMLGRRFAGGKDLSGGEWQKVALGRAYMREAQLLILDEPTAALDARAEYEVFQRFSELTKGKTAVLISHRFSTVRMADRILVLKNGGLEEIGSHEELIAKDGIYAELFNLQAEGYK